MSINLIKEKAASVEISLKKKGLVNVPPLRVVVDLDVSGSMNMGRTPFYSNGIIEDAFKKLLGLAFKFDDNGEIDVFAFDTNTTKLPTAKISDYGKYITKNITNCWGMFGGGTNYCPVLRANMRFLFGRKELSPAKTGIFGLGASPAVYSEPDNSPALVLFFTDGDCSDSFSTVSSEIEQAEKNNIPVYFHMVGIGSETTFPVLRKLANKYDNCGFINLSTIDLSDSHLYNELITDEFVAWLKRIGAS